MFQRVKSGSGDLRGLTKGLGWILSCISNLTCIWRVLWEFRPASGQREQSEVDIEPQIATVRPRRANSPEYVRNLLNICCVLCQALNVVPCSIMEQLLTLEASWPPLKGKTDKYDICLSWAPRSKQLQPTLGSWPLRQFPNEEGGFKRKNICMGISFSRMRKSIIYLLDLIESGLALLFLWFEFECCEINLGRDFRMS